MRIDRALLPGLIGTFLAYVGVLHSALSGHTIQPGDNAPAFIITADNGRTVTAKDFGGKLLIVNFWATWCGGCVAEIPSLSRLESELGREGLVVLGVSVDQDAAAYRGFLARNHVSFLTARDPQQELEHAFGTVQLPESYLIDRRGRVIEKVIGAENWSSGYMIRHLRTLL